MKDLNYYYELVESSIKDLGVPPENCRGDKEGQWNLKKGSASIWVDVFKMKDKDYGYFQLVAPVSKIPARNTLEFYQEVLELNHELYGVGMTKFKEGIYLKIIRELEDLSQSEITASLQRIGAYADKYDDYFIKKYFNTDPGADTQGKADEGPA